MEGEQKQGLKNQSGLTLRQYVWGVIVLAVVGIIDTAYLSYTRFTSSDLYCAPLTGCNIVASSPESVLFGFVPLAYLGLVFYVAILTLGLALLFRAHAFVQLLLVAAVTAGLLSSIYFVYVQAVIIEAFCVYCLLSAVTSAALFVWVLYFAPGDA